MEAARGETLSTQKQKLRQRFLQGKRFVQRQKYKLAILQFRKAIALLKRMKKEFSKPAVQVQLQKSHSTFLYVLGRTYEYDKQWWMAYQSYQKCLKYRPTRKVRRLLQQRMVRLVSTYLVRSYIRTIPSGATVYLRHGVHTQTGRSPWRVVVPSGTITARFTHPKTKPLLRQVELTQGGLWKPIFRLQGQFALLKVITTPPNLSVVVVDQEKKSYTLQSPFTQKLRPGRTRVIIRDKTYLVTLIRGQTQLLQVQPLKGVKRPHRHQKQRLARVIGYSGLAASALFGAVGGLLFHFGLKEFDSYQQKVGKPTFSQQEVVSHFSQGSRMYTSSFFVLGASGATLIASIATLVWNGGKKKVRPSAQSFPSQPKVDTLGRYE